ncbi:MAG TPA: Ig-like domain-containing protein [Kofleriaceae bacterium]|nr:Ig-like domain-containing protein [Kofleriaceae bacterium]
MLLSSTAVADRAHVVPDRRGAIPTGAVCSHGENRCFAHVHLNATGEIHALAVPNGFGPADLWSAYAINPDITTTPTVAIVDAYGYANLESDLATYRAQFGLPACTRANGCLTVMSQRGSTTQLPPNPPADDDWTVETALDIDMVSAACPHCKILVVQGDDDNTTNLYTAQLTAAAAHPAVISDSWGRAEGVGEDFSQQEPIFDHPGIATFVSGGDSGFGDGGQGPLYPSTSAKVIAVGGTSLVPSNTTRGWSEIAWVDGGSSCSFAIPKPSYQAPSPCNFRAATDISAVGDPQTGLAVFNASNGGFLVVGGTSAAAPIVASIFAGLGRGNVTAQEISQSGASLFDVTSGSNGNCGNILCNATAGWDGPTGFGTPNASALGGGGSGDTLTVAITSPSDGATVNQGFTVTATVTGSPTKVGLGIDGVLVATSTTRPYSFKAPADLAAGEHAIEVVAIDAANDQGGVEIHVTVKAASGGGDEGDTGDDTRMAGCNAGGGSSSLLGIALALAFVVRRRVRH